jgi:hypothetical protein
LSIVLDLVVLVLDLVFLVLDFVLLVIDLVLEMGGENVVKNAVGEGILLSENLVGEGILSFWRSVWWVDCRFSGRPN